MPVLPLHSLTAQVLDAKFANKQRRYESKYSASYLHHPAPPPSPRPAALPRPSNPMFETLRAAAADLNLPEGGEQHGLPAAAFVVSTRRRPVRRAMLGTVATLALCTLAAGSYYAWAGPAANGGQAAINATLAAVAQRFHDFAANQPLLRTLSEKVALLRPAPAPASEAGSAATPGPPVPDALTPAPSASPGLPKPAEPPVAVAAPDIAKAASAAATQQLASLFTLVRQVSLLVRDAQAENEKLRTQVVNSIGSLQAKMTDLEQRLVATTQDMRDARDEGAQLRTEVAVLTDTLQASSKALEQRLDLALARDPAAVASEPGKQQAEAESPASAPADDGKAVAAEATAADSARNVPGYHVQAASFGVAVISDASAAPGQAGGRLVAVGDQVPGVGRVTSITPHGTSWVVQTDHGTIQ